MGTKVIPARPEKTVKTCDVCGYSPTFLDNCIGCGRETCSGQHCKEIVSGCVVSLEICRDCPNKKLVKEIVDKFAEQFVAVFSARNAAIREKCGTTDVKPSTFTEAY